MCFHFSAEAEGYSLAHMEFNVPLNALFFKFQFSLIFDCFKRRVYPTVQTIPFQENLARPKPDVTEAKKEDTLQSREISQEYVQETWRDIIRIQ